MWLLTGLLSCRGGRTSAAVPVRALDKPAGFATSFPYSQGVVRSFTGASPINLGAIVKLQTLSYIIAVTMPVHCL